MALVALFSTSPALAQTDFGPFTASPNAAVPDNAYTGGLGGMLSSTVNVSGVTGTSVVNIEVDLSMTHTWIGDLIIKLESPDGDILTLVSRPGAAETTDDGIGGTAGSSANLDGAVLTFSDLSVNDAEAMSAGLTLSSEFVCTTNSLCDFYPNPGASAYPTQTFASLFGGNMNGDWTLYIGDHASADVGTLLSWSIRISTVSPSLFAFVGVAVAPDGDCTDEPLPATLNNVLNVAPGTGVCYFYYGENTGDVTLNLHDLQDDVQGTLLNGLPFPLAPAASVYLAIGPVVINSNTTNNATWTGYNAGPTDVAVGNASATVFVSPANDLCAGAVPLSCGASVTGTTEGSSDTDNPTGCNVFSDDLGVWYSFAGTGDAVQLSTCGSTSDASGVVPYIAVFEGSCGALTCVQGGSTQDPTCGTNGFVTSEIPTVIGVTYYVYMTAAAGFPETMDFDLTLICVPPANDDCADAVALSCGDVVTGSTVAATIDGPATSCPGLSVAADVWYTVSGTGYGITASLCGSGYDTKIEVYTGDCGALVCVGGNDDACGLQSELTWTSTLGETYRIRVHGFVGETGAYNLAITCAPDCNGEAGGTAFIDGCGICAGGNTGVAPGNSITLDMTDDFDDGWNDATYQIYDNSDPLNPVLILSGDLDNAASGDGTGIGQDILCLPNGCYLFTVGGGEYDEEIGWTLTGVDGGALSGGAPESVAFSINTTSCAVAGCTDPASLNYDAAATLDDGSCVYAPANDLCSGAIAVACGDVVSGTTIGASATDAPAGPLTISEGVWYSVVGTGGDFTVSTCSAFGFDTEISVSEGSCGSLTWVGGNDDFCGLGSEYTFTSVAGTTYYIYVGDYSTDLTNDNAGTFDLSITCTTPPCDATAGALIADASPVTLEGGSAVISATAAGLVPFVPAGYSVLYVLTEGAGLVIIDAAATPSFTVTAAGDYTIHTLVYDPNTLDVSSVVFGTTTGFDVNGLLIQGGGTICGALDVTGAPIVVEEEVTCDATAGTLVADASPVTLVGGSATISATEGTAPFVPAGYSVLYVLTEGAGLVIIDAAAAPSFTVSAAGDYTIHTLVYDPTTLDVTSVVFGTTTGFDVNGLLIQGGGTICGALDVAGAPIVVENEVTCDATAGTLVADASPVTLVGGSATISATEGTAPFVPAGYSVLYVLTEGAGLVIINAAATPSFTVSSAGDYTIHTLVYDPTTLDVTSVVFGTTTGFDVNGLLIQGGGTICGALDVTGAPIVVDEVVGISEGLDRSLSVYPNPSNGQFIVELNGAEGVGTLNIMDMMGRRVYTAGVNFTGSFRQSIDLNVAEGTYVLQVITENGIATRKVELN
jgi:subtilisin-like proprotein convertase family protein